MKTVTTVSGHTFTDYTLDDLRKEAKALAKSKSFANGKSIKFNQLVIRVTGSGASLIIQSDANFDGEVERGTML